MLYTQCGLNAEQMNNVPYKEVENGNYGAGKGQGHFSNVTAHNINKID